ncbi:hypothetical protein OUZ56_004133 [Daphnia magna]|uniref:Uncharacterized protein n=1 Tax=Daphnia magna TaxID=35525 RepID=A0ABQ9YNV0_9CRUS|nr:hypothetical protein OUZ56_004133 [Daphnia magna]
MDRKTAVFFAEAVVETIGTSGQVPANNHEKNTQMVILAGDIVYTIFGLFMHLIMRPLGGYASFDEGKIQLNDGRVFLTADADAR